MSRARWLPPALVVLITFVLVRIAVLNVFYTTGDMHDPGWLASVTWHNGWHLHGPPAFPGPYFSEHLAFILWLTNAVSYVIPLSKFDYYAALIAAIHALYAAGVWRAWRLMDTRHTIPAAVVAVFIALAATFSGIAIVALGLPHPELAIPALALWFCIAVAQRRHIEAACWLAACLATREDAGFHVFGLLILWAGVLAWRRRPIGPDVRWLLAFAAAALGYALVAFLVKRVYFPGGDVLTRSYLGDPPFHHVTVTFILDRLRFYLLWRGYVVLPFALSLIWAAMSRNPLLPLGYIAAVPWLVISIIAVHPTPGGLGYYYGFPFWLSLAWPLVASRVWFDASGMRTRSWPYVLLLLVSVVGWQRGGLVIFPLEDNAYGESPFVYHDTLRHRADDQAFVDYFQANRPLFGSTALDEAVFGLMIDHADRSTWLETWPLDQPPETMIYFAQGYEWRSRVVPLLRSGNYRCIYAVPGTPVRLATRRPLSDKLPVPMPMRLVDSSLNAPC